MRKYLAGHLHREEWIDTLAYAKALNAEGKWAAFEDWVNGSRFTRRSIIRAINRGRNT